MPEIKIHFVLSSGRIGANLASIHDNYDNAWISSLPNRSNRSSSLQGASLWIAKPETTTTTTRSFSSLPWTPSTPSPFSGAWAVGEPDPRNGNCTKLATVSEQDNWSSESCSALLPFICEMPACPKSSHHCLAESKCIAADRVCDGIFDCESRSDEFNCRNDNGAKTCSFHVTVPSEFVSSPNHPGNYPANASCLWLIEMPFGSDVSLQFVDFLTEEGKDVVTVLAGSPLPSKTVPLVSPINQSIT